ncbi:MAG: hypothetical protein R3244_08960, partial [Thermoanaerobaculia bacterium]|nr:hypothetical protein [Thermoanaerobaculia bacterium]
RVGVEGATAREALRDLERRVPSLKGWILDERGELREHVDLFVNRRRQELDTTLESTDELFVLQAISGGEATLDELLVSTRKGLFVVRGARRGELEILPRQFAGLEVEYACRDRRSGCYFAAVTHGQYGPHLYRSDSATDGWQEVEGPRFPTDVDAAVERIWVVEPGAGNDELWCGVAPAALFRSTDGGATWELNRGLWNEPSRSDWMPGMGGLCLHTVCPWPDDAERLAVAISAAGFWISEDGGASWRRGIDGLVARYLPEEARQGAVDLCVHKVERAAVRPETLYMQFHGGVYRSDDGGSRWIDIGSGSGLPADFGFPIVADPHDSDRAFVIPLNSDQDRVTPDGALRVYETRDGGRSWEPLGDGLPERHAHATILRQAFCHDGAKPLGLYFGTRTGELFASTDDGLSWGQLAAHLPPILAVRSA